ncbi:VPS10 domain-containing receptor SorCS2-like [Clytia hemisphaerica]|uniref:VPS10 domain-containing receptor SorCS2-like n=1 Tax=Clytia hemisphaerica TaxID=252671 RepID=UPI0034D6DC34
MTGGSLWCAVLLIINLNFSRAVIFPAETEDHDYISVIDRQDAGQQNRVKRSLEQYPWQQSSLIDGVDVNTTEFVMRNDSNDIAFVFWKHHKTDTIFILTCMIASTVSTGRLDNKGCHTFAYFYQSENLGANFVRNDLTEPFEGYWLHSIYLSPIDKKFIIATDYQNKTIFITHDEGKTFNKVELGFAPTFLLFHPTEKNIIAAFDNTKDGQQALFWSRDSGETWLSVTTNVKSYFWQTVQLGKTGEQGFFFEKLDIFGAQIDGKITSALYQFPFPKPNGINRMMRRETGLVQDSVYIGDEFVLMQKANDMNIYIIRPKYEQHATKVVYRYRNSKDHQHHAVISTDNNEILMGVFHFDRTVTVYLSDSTGTFFNFVTDDVKCNKLTDKNKMPKIDFTRVKGMSTTYIANKQLNGTFISLDKGFSWNPLNYQRISSTGIDLNNMCTVGKDDSACRLKLHIVVEGIYSSFTAPLMSKESAPGVIIAQGRIVNTRVKEDEMLHHDHLVFISTDGGRYWKQTLENSYAYAILDHGNVLAAMPLSFSVKQEIRVSLDLGKKWHTFSKTARYSRITAIIADQTAKTLIVNVFGFLSYQPQGSDVKQDQWIVWKFDFSNVLKRQCRYDDYERYYPGGYDKCILGQTFSFLKVKRNPETQLADCYSPPSHNLRINYAVCDCTKRDFECDTNYIRVPVGYDSYNCKLANEKHWTGHKYCDRAGFFYNTKGYRKRQGDKCKGGVDENLSPTKKPCGNFIPVVKIKSTRITVGINENVDFYITHSVRSENTMYSWRFGDNATIVGTFDKVSKVSHYYTNIGHYTVNLMAHEGKNTYTDSFTIIVLDKTYHNAYIKYNAPVIADQANTYTLQRLGGADGQTEMEPEHSPKIKFLWSFKGVYNGATDSHEANHTFGEVGVYQVECQIVSPVNAQTVVRLVRVYKSAYAIDLLFSSYLDRLNSGTHTWASDFLYKLKNFLVNDYDIDNTEERVITEIKSTNPMRARVTFTDVKPMEGREYESAESIAQRILKDINKSKPIIPAYRVEDIHVTEAKNLGYVHSIKNGENGEMGTTSKVWIYVVVMVALILVLTAVVLYVRVRRNKRGLCYLGGVFIRKDKSDIMQKHLVMDEDCVGLEGPDLPSHMSNE